MLWPVPTFTNPVLAPASQTPYRIACPPCSPGKEWPRTFTGAPSGRHSRPACAYSPTSSFFLASTLITGCPAARCSLAWAAIYRNRASRSGCRRPSMTLASAWAENPCSCRSRHAVCGLHRCPAAVSSSDRRITLLAVHASGDSGSPRAQSSTSASSAGTSPGPAPASFLRPPPGRRMRPSAATCPDPGSAAPSATVCHDAPVIFATAVTPPSPAARATAPSASRRAFSSSTGSSNSSSGPISFTRSAFAPIAGSWHPTRQKLGLFRNVYPVHRINLRARINHASRSDSLRAVAGDGHARRGANIRHAGVSGNRCLVCGSEEDRGAGQEEEGPPPRLSESKSPVPSAAPERRV